MSKTDDALYSQAVDIVVTSQRVSVSSIQRQLRIGFSQACGYIDEMQTLGIVSAPDAVGRRTVLIADPVGSAPVSAQGHATGPISPAQKQSTPPPEAPGGRVAEANRLNTEPYVMEEHRGFPGVCSGLSCKAVLLRLGGQMETVIQFRYPPPRDYREPIRRKLQIEPTDDASYIPALYRTFERDDRLRSPDHKWWLVYNNGHTQSPMDAYVYREIPVRAEAVGEREK